VFAQIKKKGLANDAFCTDRKELCVDRSKVII